MANYRDSRVGDVVPVEDQHLEVCETLQVSQPRVRYVSLFKVELFQSRQAGQVREALVSNCVTREAKLA